MRGFNHCILDHYYLRLVNNCLFVVVGNKHLDYGFVGYVKYCPSVTGSSIWVFKGVPLERLVKWYDVREVHGFTPWKIYVPHYDAVLPYVPRGFIIDLYDPVNRLLEIISSPRDSLEEHVIGFAEKLSSLVNGLTGLGVSGSILPGIHNPLYSDVDIVVYGWRRSVDIVESIRENKDIFRPFTEGKLLEWAHRIAGKTGLTLKQVLSLYRNWRRGLFNGREYSILYNNDISGFLTSEPEFKTIGSVLARVEIKGGVEALSYPSVSGVENYTIIEGAKPLMDITYIESFESLYIPILYEGGKAVVKGLLQCSDTTCRILVGGVEEKGFIMPGDTA
ncbi:hypothetical protein [Desulfurococcus amylolyticus]|uniref:Polymerase nucleotidyl transferase domain-containing protein n=1 Tax=Desulfurococcus amylolyticus DSM 16532 TaxID=768672 RepID=I3XSD7_DESAM|nr:hypothetical protein [Desulfurococcus amylolyticus]AFL66861.1 hypothetical protein Desfe_0975 [Desulfurococcus amylolyticus DSM 16532]